MNIFKITATNMKFHRQMESILIAITTVLCTILLLKLLYNLRSTLVWRVNCWFCNNNFWIKFINRNSWICPKCEQYNGFTKDGDYNKALGSSLDQSCKFPKVFQRSPPKNGLCKMCNINQQLKVTQLANFVPMNEHNYDQEIDSYRLHLEKAYKLCSPCKKVLQIKLHKEKETLLGSKLLETRTPERKSQKEKENQDMHLRNFVNSTSASIAGALVILIALECYSRATKHKNLSSTIYNIKEIVYSLLERIINIVKMKTLLTFPSLENMYDIENITNLYVVENFNTGLNDMTQKVLGVIVCLIQIIGIVWNTNKLKYTISIDLLWLVFLIASLAHQNVPVEPLTMSLIKLASTSAVFLIYRHMKTKTGKLTKNLTRKPVSPRKMKNLVNGTMNTIINNDDNVSSDTDDDVSLSKFGLHNLTESSNETISPLLNKSLVSGRSFTPRTDSIWGKPKLNSTFCVNSALISPVPLSDTVFIKPSFNRYQKLTKDDSDSDLDESISSLCISSPKKKASSNKSIFTLRKFTASPNFVTPTPTNRARPLISPSKLGHSTSWVAGGYWGSEGERQIFSINGSRSSSQSSGFESQASSMNQRNIFSQPPSREESICGEPDRASMLLDRFQNNRVHYNVQNPQTFTPISSPVFPQMQYNNHVQIPQPQFPRQTFASRNVFNQQQQFVPNGMFKAPEGSRLIKLPPVNSFASH